MFSSGRLARFQFVFAILLLIHTVADPAREASSYCPVDRSNEIETDLVDTSVESSFRDRNGSIDSPQVELRRRELSISRDRRSLESLGLNPRGSKYLSSVSLIVRANLVHREGTNRIAMTESTNRSDDESVLAADFDFLRTPTHETRGKPWDGIICVL